MLQPAQQYPLDRSEEAILLCELAQFTLSGDHGPTHTKVNQMLRSLPTVSTLTKICISL